MPNLKLIAARSTGFDHIDLAACRERNIVVANIPFYGENTVAEHTFGRIIFLLKFWISLTRRWSNCPRSLM
jgi:D-lactate dehydrogenase